ncbi:hypothetical protein G6F57_019262 [Rhizopus arrhizus]|nr:hypothetical protein G6F57_019262 [Rhizopus arrhizus]
MRRRQQGVRRQRIGIGESGLLAADGAHAHALADREASSLDDALFQAPPLAARVLEVQVGVIDLVGEDFTQRARHVRFSQAPGVQQQRFGGGKGCNSGINDFHRLYSGGAGAARSRALALTLKTVS